MKYDDEERYSLTLSLNVPGDLGLATSKTSLKRNICRGLAFMGRLEGAMAHGASIVKILEHLPLLLSKFVRSLRDFLRIALLF